VTRWPARAKPTTGSAASAIAPHATRHPIAPSGSRYTVEDLARFAHALLSHKLLSPDATKLLINGKAEALPGPLGGRYAYGFEDARHADGNGWVGHGGGAPGMNGDLRIYPKSG
jgi:D-alanyl-D-alanine carboxypeptidase